MSVTIYRSVDSGAPILTGEAGSLLGVLDACLVNGYGTQTAAGWTIAFTGANLRDYCQGAGSNQFYLSVNDAGPGLGTFKEARIRGYESMSALGVGIAAFPATTQEGSGLFVRKSATLDATPRAWIVVADQRTFYMFMIASTAGIYLAWMFGEFYSFKENDPGRCMIIGRAAEDSTSVSTSTETMDTQHRTNTTIAAHYMARNHVGAPGSFACTKFGDLAVGYYGSGTLTTLGPGSGYEIAYPNPTDMGIYIAPIHVSIPNVLRGRMRGFWHFCHRAAAVTDGDTITGSGDLAGRTFLIIKAGGGGSAYLIESSDTWETN